MSQPDADRVDDQRYLIAQGDQAAVQALLDQGVITEALARILVEKVKIEAQDLRIVRGLSRMFRILD